MAITLKDSGDPTPLESGGSAEPLNAELTGQNYEQITSALKAGAAGAAPEEPSPPESPAAATQEPGGEDELRLMTDEEIKALPQELQRDARAMRKKLLDAYSQKSRNLADIRRQAEFADRFESDPEFRSEQIRKYGFQPQPTGQPVQAQPGQPLKVPPQYVELRRQTLPAELQWIAESLALGDYQRDLAMYQGYIQPLQKRYETGQQEQATKAYREAESSFAEQNPGWDAHEDSMVEALEFLKGPELTHPRFGNKLALLYSLVTGSTQEPKVVQQVLERTAQAVRNKSVTGGGGRGTTPNIEERVQKAKTDREAWDVARTAAKAGRA